MTLFGGVNFIQGGISVTGNQRPLMNVAERAADTDETARRNNDKLAAMIRVAMPAQVVSFDSAKQTIVAQPLVREKIINRQTGQVGFVTLPQLVDVPVCFSQAGNFVLTMPVQAGDEVLLVCTDTCMDSWWYSGGIQNWNDRRRHDLSDAIAVVGLNSRPNTIQNIASDATELRSKDGNVSISVREDSTLITVGDDTTIEATEDDITLSAAGSEIVLDNTGVSITGTLTINGHAYLSHRHGGVEPGPSNTSPVIP